MRSARPRKFYVVPSIVDVRMRQHRSRTKWRACAKVRKEKRARERERTYVYVNDFTNERPWDRRSRAGAPLGEWADRVNVNAS